MLFEKAFNLKTDKAFSGHQAIRMVSQRYEKMQSDSSVQMYRLIIMDINMPELDGVKTTKIIR